MRSVQFKVAKSKMNLNNLNKNFRDSKKKMVIKKK